MRTKAETRFLAEFEKYLGRTMSEQEKNLAIKQADQVGMIEPTEAEKLAKLEQATGPEELREALKGWTPEELAEAGIV